MRYPSNPYGPIQALLRSINGQPDAEGKRFVRHYTGDDVSSDIATIIETLALSANRALHARALTYNVFRKRSDGIDSGFVANMDTR